MHCQYLRPLGIWAFAFSKRAKDTGCDFVSLFGVVPKASMTKDGVHPDAVDNAAIAHALLPRLVP